MHIFWTQCLAIGHPTDGLPSVGEHWIDEIVASEAWIFIPHLQITSKSFFWWDLIKKPIFEIAKYLSIVDDHTSGGHLFDLPQG